MSAFLDTDVLLYAVGGDPAEEKKRKAARVLLEGTSVCLSMQVLQEFVWQATRPHKGGRLDLQVALRFVAGWRRFPIQETTLALFDAGMRVLARHKLSFWDSMIVAAALAQGCDLLYSEDMQDGRIIEGLRIADPFR